MLIKGDSWWRSSTFPLRWVYVPSLHYTSWFQCPFPLTSKQNLKLMCLRNKNPLLSLHLLPAITSFLCFPSNHNTGMPHLLVLCYIMLHRCQVFYILKAKPSRKKQNKIQLTWLLYSLYCSGLKPNPQYLQVRLYLPAVVNCCLYFLTSPSLSSAHSCQKALTKVTSFFFDLSASFPN